MTSLLTPELATPRCLVPVAPIHESDPPTAVLEPPRARPAHAQPVFDVLRKAFADELRGHHVPGDELIGWLHRRG